MDGALILITLAGTTFIVCGISRSAASIFIALFAFSGLVPVLRSRC
jgi:hypothetical protein